MRYITLGKNCFYGKIALELNKKNNVPLVFILQTSFLASGGISYSNSALKHKLFFLRKIYKYIMTKIICYTYLIYIVLNNKLKEKNIHTCDDTYLMKHCGTDILLYYIFSTKFLPKFNYHAAACRISNCKKKSYKNILYHANYKSNPADVYIFAETIRNTFLNKLFLLFIYKQIEKINKNAILIVFSPYKIHIKNKNIKTYLLQLNHIDDMKLIVLKLTYDKLCMIFNHKFRSLLYC